MDKSDRRVLLAHGDIAARVRELGARITAHYAGRRPLFLGIMNGALFFLADLVRAVEIETEIACVRLASYKGTASIGQVRGLDGLDAAVRGREVLVVDDILDTGCTLAAVTARLREMGALDVRVCTLLEKRRGRANALNVDWVGFQIEDVFVVGYGLDHDGLYRGLPDIEVLQTSGSPA